MSFEPLEYLRHIYAEAEYLLEASVALKKDEFLRSNTLRRAFVRSLEVIGEAAKKVPQDFRNGHPDVEWKSMAGMRDRLIHGYFGIDYDLVWDVIKSKMPKLKGQLEQILKGATLPPESEGPGGTNPAS